jgi:hypothetical protein
MTLAKIPRCTRNHSDLPSARGEADRTNVANTTPDALHASRFTGAIKLDRDDLHIISRCRLWLRVLWRLFLASDH